MQRERVKRIFDANIILSNAKLDKMISETMNRYYGKRTELSEEETEIISAAGEASNIWMNKMSNSGKLED